ncbi:transglutaminase-like cysteine peptidase [Hoeflea alexandrii]|uniref:transglutaminase-like cysteine peptidase n=2 Tax=Hoeflea alexandrii TaxID=288436 RepID=UPI0022702CB3|nr:transglutaminase-like cysteine peptidase [Hoeflea alexandrii]MCY0154215.1 transglutaminase-like cysteine peptidase [Hoeflea alexandrii]
MFCATAAQANVYAEPKAQLQVSSPAATPVILAETGVPAPQWLLSAHRVTTLRLTQAGLEPLGLDRFAHAAASNIAPERAPLSGFAALAPRDRITTASIPVPAPRPATRAARRDTSSQATSYQATSYQATSYQATSQAVSRTIRQDRPLFGAHRIRFGKIGSGARISGLIRNAASTGASAICINSCADLADRLDLGGADITAQLRHVSASVNTLVTYRTDEETHGRLDQWSTPNETLGRASGDCEDYAILKMAVLARLGVPVNAMEIVVVKDTSRRLFHAVLSVTLEDRTLILDNMTDAVETDTAKRSYAPLFSLSGTANYVFGYKGGKQNLTASLKNIASIAPGAGF